MVEKIRAILRHPPKGHPYAYLSAYQIAVEFQRRYPEDARRLGLPLGSPEGNEEGTLPYVILALIAGRIPALDLWGHRHDPEQAASDYQWFVRLGEAQ